MTDQSRTALRLWVVLNRAARSVEEQLSRQVQSHGLSMTEFAVLEVLLSKGTLPIGEVGGRVLRASGSMTYVIDKLESRGLIRRLACPTDRRVVFGELTDEGRALIERVFDEHAGLLEALCAGLTPDEQTTAADLLRRLGLYARDFRPLAPAA